MIECLLMAPFRATLAVIASLLLAAHLLRLGSLPLAVGVALLPLLLTVPRGWSVRTVQLALAVGALEWIRTLFSLVDARRRVGLPVTRLSIILVAVAAFTAVAALALRGWRGSESGEEAG